MNSQISNSIDLSNTTDLSNSMHLSIIEKLRYNIGEGMYVGM
jgi:hypothetical protein